MSTIDFAAARAKHPALPEKPTGWKANLVMHMNFGRKGGAACYRLIDPDGIEMPLTKFYNQPDNRRGFHIDGDDTDYVTWTALRDAWAKATSPPASSGATA